MHFMKSFPSVCSREGCSEARSKGQIWCRGHAAEYQKEYRKTRSKLLENRDFRRGAEAMRRAAIQLFSGMPTVEFTGRAAAAFLEKLEPNKFT